MTLAEAYGKHSKKGASNSALWRYSSGYKWAGHFPIRPQIDWRQCPILFVDDLHQLGFRQGG